MTGLTVINVAALLYLGWRSVWLSTFFTGRHHSDFVELRSKIQDCVSKTSGEGLRLKVLLSLLRSLLVPPLPTACALGYILCAASRLEWTSNLSL